MPVQEAEQGIPSQTEFPRKRRQEHVLQFPAAQERHLATYGHYMAKHHLIAQGQTLCAAQTLIVGLRTYAKQFTAGGHARAFLLPKPADYLAAEFFRMSIPYSDSAISIIISE